MKKCWIAGLVMVLLILSCKPQVKGGETAGQTGSLATYARSGTQGLQVSFAQNLPPASLYDTSDLIIVSELKNVGAYNLENERCFIELSGPDPNIVLGLNNRQNCGDIEGKSVYNTEGSFNQIEFKSANMYLPQGVNKYSPNLVLSTCYNYRTIASPQVCLDPSFYQLTAEQKACQVKDVVLGGGQGAPVSVDNVKVSMAGQKAIFEISLSNLGGGRVINPYASLALCPRALEYDDFDKVGFTVILGGNILPDKCTPGDNLARIISNKGKIFCTFNIGNTPAYETPLQIELNYNYLQSVSKKIDIIKTPG